MIDLTLENFQTIQKDLISELENATHTIEETIMRIADGYPALMLALEDSISVQTHEIHSVKKGLGLTAGSQSADSISRNSIRNILSQLHALEGTDTGLLSALEQGLELLQRIEGNIDSINEDSIEMELISLNAMTVALKAGVNGRGFSVITDELKKLSTRIMENADQVSLHGGDLRENFIGFTRRLEQIYTNQSSLNARFEPELADAFASFRSVIGDVIREIEELSSRGLEIKKPITGLMVDIQNQDIIRQSIDSVFTILQTLKDRKISSDDRHGRLDHFAFIQLLPDLCYALLENIREQVLTLSSMLNDRLDDIDREVNEISRSLEDFIRNALHGSENSIANQFRAARDNSRMILDMAGALMNEKQNEVNESVVLMKKVAGLERIFKTSKDLVTRFRTIDVAARIEVQKNEILGQMSDAVDQMSALTDRISGHIDDSAAATAKFIQKTRSSIASFTSSYEAEAGQLQSLLRETREQTDIMDGIRQRCIDMLTDFAIFNERFKNLFRESQGNLEQLSQLNEIIAHVQARLNELSSKTEENYRHELEEAGLRSWEIQNREIQKLMAKFTVYSHKQTAGILGGADAGAAADPGEVTYF